MYLSYEQHQAIEKLFYGIIFFGAIFVFIIAKMKWWKD